MNEARVIYHREPEGWWAESPDLPGYSAWGEELHEVIDLVKEGVPLFLEDESVVMLHLIPGEVVEGALPITMGVPARIHEEHVPSFAPPEGQLVGAASTVGAESTLA
jgi:predicted RNase H-like HicB family nuclease